MVQIYDQMMEVSNYYGTVPVFGIDSTGREWRFFKLPNTLDVDNQVDASLLSLAKVKRNDQDNSSPLTGNMGQINNDTKSDSKNEGILTGNMGQIDYDIKSDSEMDVDLAIEELQPELICSKIYKWDDKEMLFALGAVLKQMSTSKRTMISTVTNESIKDRVVWHLVKLENIAPWGWVKLPNLKLNWTSMMLSDTKNVYGMLGRGADGKVLLVANTMGQVSAMKMIKDGGDTADNEAKNWQEVYMEYCDNYKWSVRCEKWMGIPSVIMPVLNQFTTHQERLNNLNGVEKCLKSFHAKGFLHSDVYWRNIGYFRANGEIVIVVMDLHPSCFYKEVNDGAWIGKAIETLKKRAYIQL